MYASPVLTVFLTNVIIYWKRSVHVPVNLEQIYFLLSGNTFIFFVASIWQQVKQG